GHPFLDRLDAALVDAVPSAIIGVRGEWASRARRSYQAKVQLGSGLGPCVEVVDHVWDGHLTAASPFTGMALLHTDSGIHWAKAAHASQELSVRVSLHGHGHADHETDRMTFAVGLDDVLLPSVAVEASFAHPSECLVATDHIPAGRVACLARTGGRSFFVVLFASESVKFGRNRLWRLRDPIANQLPSDLGALLTRRRAGVLRPQPLP